MSSHLKTDLRNVLIIIASIIVVLAILTVLDSKFGILSNWAANLL